MDRDLKEKSIKIKKEISELKKDLTKVNVEKEKWFTVKEGLKKEISNLIKSIRSLRSSKGESNTSIKDLKEKRDKYNKEVKNLISTFKELQKKKTTIKKDKRMSDNPSSIQKKIEELELKIETEGLPFEKEQKLMKQIKQLKKELGDVSENKELTDSSIKISKEIDQAKKLAEDYHSRLKTQLSKTSSGYSEFQELAKQISTLKQKQEEAFKNFIESKNTFSKINETLKDKLMDASKTHGRLTELEKTETTDRRRKHIEEKEKEVEEKLKTKKKLTTEDLLVFQKDKPHK